MKKATFFVLLSFILIGCSGSGDESEEVFHTTPSSGSFYETNTFNLDTSNALYHIKFDNHPEGYYIEYQVNADHGYARRPSSSSSIYGIHEKRVYVIGDSNEKYIRILYPKGTYGHDGGAHWVYEIKSSEGSYFDDLRIGYKVKFEPGFEFSRGGKLPGLGGGDIGWASGCYNERQPNGYNAWSVRTLWEWDGSFVQYVYHPDQKGSCGDKFIWSHNNSKIIIRPGLWYFLETQVRLNSPGSNDGFIKSWVNGVEVLNKTGLRFRETSNLHIDVEFFDTFFGGNDKTYEAKKDEYIYFDDIVISQNKIYLPPQ